MPGEFSVLQLCKSSFSDPLSITFRLNTKVFRANLRIQCQRGKTRTSNDFNSFSMFFDCESHVNFLFYLVFIFTTLRNSNNFFHENLSNLLPSFLSMVIYICMMSSGSNLGLFHLYTFLYCCDESLKSVRQLKMKQTTTTHRHKKRKKLQEKLSERSVVIVRKYIHSVQKRFLSIKDLLS